jgi:Protein of unknown function (DUF1566)
MTIERALMGTTDATGGTPNYVEDVFSTWLYTGNGSTQTITNGIALASGFNLSPGTALAGGYFGGFISTTGNGVATHALIVAPKATGENSSRQWKTSQTSTAGTSSLIDGPANSANMNNASHPAAQFCEGLTIGGFSDWYMPAKNELEVLYYFLKPTTDANNTSSGSNANAVSPQPINTNYTSGAPAQTSATAFRSGFGAEAFAAGGYWSSTEYSATAAWFQGFYLGSQSDYGKDGSLYVRAVRRVAIADALLDPYRVTGQGGLVWIKQRNGTGSNSVFDTARGAGNAIITNATGAQSTDSAFSAFNSSGFSLNGSSYQINFSGDTYASWTFREAPKFFDVVTYTGNGANRTIAHNLGSVPGMIIVKRTDTTGDWQVYHRSLANTEYMVLNSTAGKATGTTRWNSTTPTSTVFSLGTDATVNASGSTYVAYLFAHDAGGFGASGTDNVVSCGSYTGNGSATGPVIDLGWEPQWLLIKSATQGGEDWQLFDVMRGWSVTDPKWILRPNMSNAESSSASILANSSPNSTGFQITASHSSVNQSGATYIYMAIRRGPMRTPTTGTSVFGLNARTGTGANATVTGSAGISDAVLIKGRANAVGDLFAARLTGTGYLETSATTAEVAAGTTILQTNPWDVMDGVKVGTTSLITNTSGATYINYLFDRAPGFFDVVCWAGNEVAGRQINHNLAVAPELLIMRSRTTVTNWYVNAPSNTGLLLDTTLASNNAYKGASAVSGTTFTPITGNNVTGRNYVAYLFATCPGVSKCGSYTGTAATQTINCGFTGGARFVLIKRTDFAGDWFTYDTARGMVSGTNPYFLMNSTAAESNTNAVFTSSTGFTIQSTAPAGINASGGSFIYLAIA